MSVLLVDGMSLLKSVNMMVARFDNGFSFSFLRSLRATLEDVRKRHKSVSVVIVCWDGNPKARKETLPGYKSSRTRSPVNVGECRNKIKEILPSLGVYQAYHRDWEGDDLLAYFAQTYSENGNKVVIWSGDFDLRQMISENVELHQKEKSSKKKKEGIDRKTPFITLDNFEDVTGFRNPKEWLLGKTVIGDGSDEIPGLKEASVDTVRAYLSNVPMKPVKKKLLRDWFDNSPGFLQALSLMKLPHEEFDYEAIEITPPKQCEKTTKKLLGDYGFASILKGFPNWWKTFMSIGPI